MTPLTAEVEHYREIDRQQLAAEAELRLIERAERYVRMHAEDMHDDVDVAPYIKRMCAIADDPHYTAGDKEVMLAAVAYDLIAAHVSAAREILRGQS